MSSLNAAEAVADILEQDRNLLYDTASQALASRVECPMDGSYPLSPAVLRRFLKTHTVKRTALAFKEAANYIPRKLPGQPPFPDKVDYPHHCGALCEGRSFNRDRNILREIQAGFAHVAGCWKPSELPRQDCHLPSNGSRMHNE